ncbi:hypothetical protein jhhlp_000490 [Lomentospora prolificans]|uniref:protein-ribulosamine 3-kinase n=1 Tax=Lomentospora prolificans TaxID=41688 RepID=A0A2N3NL64_9PEZI|nr:hypothetical protein jhhlp_000490 [Lomentospora prolificans]
MTQSNSELLQIGRAPQLDPAILKHLPLRCRVLVTKAHGVSSWATTARIDVERENGRKQSFFIKVVARDTGKAMVHGEFRSMSEIFRLMPDFVPKPIAWGTYQSKPNVAFFLREFKEMTGDMPRPASFATSLAKLHQTSVSPTGQFGFDTTTYAGNLPQFVKWENSWEVFFSKSLKHALNLEIAAKGRDKELELLIPALFNKVIPRLLRPLESGGRTVKPSLVHGDLWYANSGNDVNTNKPLVFDACSFYAHNEYEFGRWRTACNRFGPEYIAAYTSIVQVSAPKEDFEGRLDLYRLVINVMRGLVEKYGGD